MITTYKNFEIGLRNDFQTLDHFFKKYKQIKESSIFNVEEIPFSKLDKWKFVNDYSSIVHDSGKFFKIEGLRVRTNYGTCSTWDQPIINQPEIGILGIITKVVDGIRYFLMQLKMEPGNINVLQLSPTVQATKSNFSQVHKGKATLFLEYFIEKGKSSILIDQLQSEQGGRFLRKRNRNMVVEVYDNFKIPDNFFWLTLGEIKQLLNVDNLINMDARSVISTIPLETYNIYSSAQHTSNEVLKWYIDKKVKYELEVEKYPLCKLDGWKINDLSIHNSDRFYSIIAIKVESGSREVSSWTQPMVKDKNVGLIGFITQKKNGILHYLVQTKVMPGNIDIIDMSPSISISNYLNVEHKPLFFDYFINRKNVKVIYDVLQSEEGGRFYHLQNRNMIVEIPENEHIKITDDYIWITYDQIVKFMPYGLFNIEARSLIASIK